MVLLIYTSYAVPHSNAFWPAAARCFPFYLYLGFCPRRGQKPRYRGRESTAMLQNILDRLRRTMSDRHDRQHLVDARRGWEGAGVGHKQSAHLVALVLAIDHRLTR